MQSFLFLLMQKQGGALRLIKLTTMTKSDGKEWGQLCPPLPV